MAIFWLQLSHNYHFGVCRLKKYPIKNQYHPQSYWKYYACFSCLHAPKLLSYWQSDLMFLLPGSSFLQMPMHFLNIMLEVISVSWYHSVDIVVLISNAIICFTHSHSAYSMIKNHKLFAYLGGYWKWNICDTYECLRLTDVINIKFFS